MAHPLRTLLKREASRNAQNINAQFVEMLGGGWCYVILSDTGETVRARVAVSVSLAAGQSVIVSRPDGSGRSSNTGYTVIQTANSSPDTSTPIEQETQMVGASITSIDPNPAIIEGGDTVAIVVRGIGFTSVPAFETTPAYGSASLTDASAPIITDTEIALSVAVAWGITPGDYSLEIGTLKTEETYFQVATKTTPENGSLWILTYETEDYIPKMYRVDAADLSVFRVYDFDASEVGIADVLLAGTVIFARGGGTLLRVQSPGGTPLGSTLALQSLPEEAGGLGQNATTLFYGDFFASILADLDISSLVETTRAMSTGFNYVSQILVDGDSLWIAVPDQGTGTLIEWSISGDAEVQRTSALGRAIMLAQDATTLYVGRTGSVVSVAKSDITTITATSGAYPDASTATGRNQLRLINGFLYVTYGDGGGGGFARLSLDLASMNPVDIADGPRGFTYSAATLKFFVGDLNGGITVIDETSMLADGRTVVSSKEVNRLLYV